MRHFLFAFCWLLISVSDSIEVGEILGHWLGFALWDIFSLSLSHFVFSPVPLSSFPCVSASLLASRVSLPGVVAVCLGVRFVNDQEMARDS